jgi:hypothetical protein
MTGMGRVKKYKDAVRERKVTIIFELFSLSQIRALTLNNGDADLTPIDLLVLADKELVCAPKTCVKYSSLGYELLGLALTQLHKLVRGRVISLLFYS